MTTGPDKIEIQRKLFTLLELKDATKLISDVLIEKFGFHTTGFVIWDEDLEEYVDECAYGEKLDYMLSYLSVQSSKIDQSSAAIDKLELENLGHSFRIILSDCACMVLSGEEALDGAVVEEFIKNEIMVDLVLSNSWNYTELIRENHRLRSSYDELEDKTTSMEDETRKLINDLTVRESLRTKQVERERLVYWISHSV